MQVAPSHAVQSPKCRRARNLPFTRRFAGGGECKVGMNICINTQVEIVPPPFCPAWFRGAQMRDARKLGEEGADMPRKPRSNPKTKHQAIQLRKKSPPAELKLWSRIRNDQLGVAFRRHTCPAPICTARRRKCVPDGKAPCWRTASVCQGAGGAMGHAVGNYIPDFCSPKAKLIIELDGSQHLDQAAV